MPVFPDVGSMIVPPGLSLPVASASSTIDSAMRSLIEPPGFARSDLIQTLALAPNRRMTRICGVLPIVSRMLEAFICGSVQLARGKGMPGSPILPAPARHERR
jgi:hypothetical protein